MPPDLDLCALTGAQKDALIVSLFARVKALERRVGAFLRPPKTPGNSGMPPSRGQKPQHPAPDSPNRRVDGLASAACRTRTPTR